MPYKSNSILIVLTLIFGVMIGSLILILSAWQAGFLDFDKDANIDLLKPSFVSGMGQ